MRLALFGKSGVGKDFITQKIIESRPQYTRLSFSDSLKDLTLKCFSWMDNKYNTPELKEVPLNLKTSQGEIITDTPREIWLKMNFLRNIENKIFIRILDEKFISLKDKDNVIISDVRTKEELFYCLENKFKIIKVVNENPFHKSNFFDLQQDDSYFSENIDLTFINDMNSEFDIENFFKVI